MADARPPVGDEPSSENPRSLRHVRAAQLRSRAIRWGIGKSALGTIFLIGALSYAFGPDPTSSSSRLWMTILVVLSTFHVGLGLRTFAKVRRRVLRLWWVGAVAWAALATMVLRLLSGR